MEIESYAADIEGLFADADPVRLARAEPYVGAISDAREIGGGVLLRASVGTYSVEIDHYNRWAACSCPDRQDRGAVCKHILALALRWKRAKVAEREMLDPLTAI
jgi:uncharacterized Zn finger protein